MKNKIGLFFGSFNPIHIGHLIIADYILENSDLNVLWFVVSPSNPLKDRNILLDEQQRFYMVKLATEEDSRFSVCDTEFHLSSPSYTCNTLQYLTKQYPENQFIIIMGEDNLEHFDKWKNGEQILENHEIYYYPRFGFDAGKWKRHAHIHRINAPLIEISSSMIRENIRKNKNVRYYLPSAVVQYIEKMNFYK